MPPYKTAFQPSISKLGDDVTDQLPAARFRVAGTSTLPSLKRFVVFGDIESGAVKPGMKISFTCNSMLAVTETIGSMEYVLREGREYLALCIHYSDEDQRGILEGLNIGNEVCDIHVA